ncbi:uncharacterized protein UTRI_05795_B [Ustilago trichophora]|uniref:Uncharacterized protein n=1 Tax=Ustilago trichophora TaxID=86804 RepID=A0A5C3ERR1_9BASI|nr:uncharacterized protein UTRI_05795_B [Ustilago trichophora]
MSDRYHGSAYRSGGRGPPRDDRRYPPRHHHHHREDHDYGYDARESYPSSYYPDPRGGYGGEHRPRRVHKAIPPPRPWDYSRRPLPRNEQERMELEREREAWEAKEEERYRQRMEERERERERDRERAGPGGGPPAHHGGGWGDYDADERMYRAAGPEGYDRERMRHADHLPPRRPRSRSPGVDPRYEQRGSYGRTSIGSSEGRERELDRSSGAAPPAAERPDPASGYHARRSPPPLSAASTSAAVSHIDTPEAPRFRSDARDMDPRSTPRGPASREAGFFSTPPTGPRASRGPPMAPSSGYRGGPREGPGPTGPYTPGGSDREASSYLSPSNGRFARSARDGPPPPGGAYRGGHPSFGRGRRDTNPYDSGYPEDDGGYRGYGGAHPGSSPHEASPYSPSTSITPGGHLAAPRLSRTSSSQTPTTPAGAGPSNSNIPTGPSAAAVASPTTTTTITTPAIPHFSLAYKLTPDLDTELFNLENARNTFISTSVLGSKRTAIRLARTELKDAELDYASATSRRLAAEKSLEVARETADAYSLEENRKEELLRLMNSQLQQPVV